MGADATTKVEADPIVTEAKKRFTRCVEWEGESRSRFIDDLKFAHGDSDNGFQWPNALMMSRAVNSRPCLTMNVIRQHNLQIVNDLKKNKSGMNVRPAGGGATKEASDVVRALIRHIEYQSMAQAAYSTAAEFQVAGGIGWWRLVTDYADNDTFEQEIFIRRVQDPLTVYMDPDCQMKDCSDAKFAFVFDTVPKDEFDRAYPEFKDVTSLQPMNVGASDGDWVTKDHVRVAEYFRKVPKKDKLVSFVAPDTGERVSIRASKLPEDVLESVLEHPLTKWREIVEDEIEWKLIVGGKICDDTVWVGKYIPLIRVIGEETTIEGELDRKGHTRSMKDAQRMYNYNSSAQVEFVALQGKSPWIAPSKAIEGYETMWNSANLVNHSVLIWNHVDEDGSTPIPPPFKPAPPTAAPAFEAGMGTAFNQMMMTSGQWQNQMGMMGNERTGAAIEKRQDQGETATFHFTDNFLDSIRYTGVQILDLIPKIYDTKRMVSVIGEDGTEFELQIDPAARQTYMQRLDHQGNVIERVLNPNLGKFTVEADAGPALGTRRQETVNALTTIITQAPGLTGIIGDLLMSSMDFEKAQEAALRLRRMVPKVALGEGPTQNEQQQQQMIEALQGALAKSLEKHGKDQLKLVGKDQKRDIDAYKAETDRMKALAKDLGIDPEGLQAVIQQLVGEALQTHLAPILEANQDGVVEQSGADNLELLNQPTNPNDLAPGHEWALVNPQRSTRLMRIGPLAQQRTLGR